MDTRGEEALALIAYISLIGGTIRELDVSANVSVKSQPLVNRTVNNHGRSYQCSITHPNHNARKNTHFPRKASLKLEVSIHHTEFYTIIYPSIDEWPSLSKAEDMRVLMSQQLSFEQVHGLIEAFHKYELISEKGKYNYVNREESLAYYLLQYLGVQTSDETRDRSSHNHVL